MSISLKQDSDEIVRSLGDMLLHLGCDTGCLVPNTTLNASNLNKCIAQYQKHLDDLELEVASAIKQAKSKNQKPEVVEKKEEVEAVDNWNNNDFGSNNDFANNDFGSTNGFGNNNDFELFGAVKDNDDYGIMDDFF